MMYRSSFLLALLSTPFVLAGGCGGDDDAADAVVVETLVPEPAGAPAEVADGRLPCLGNNDPGAPDGTVIELVGYVRTYADPTAAAPPPAAAIDAFNAGGTALGSGFADPSKDGRVALSVPVQQDGFTGYVIITAPGYVDYRFQTNRPVAATEANGWTWLVTPAELDSFAIALGTTVDPARGHVIGGVHDCDNFGVGSAVITVGGASEGISYLDTFDVNATRTFTDPGGRFLMPNVAPGPVVVKAYGRLAAGGPLTLLSSVQTVVTAGAITAVALQPRVGSN